MDINPPTLPVGKIQLVGNKTGEYVRADQIRRLQVKVKALWDYKGQDLDEISFEEGDIFDLIAEGKKLHLLKDHTS